MPFVIMIAGIVLVVASARNKQGDLFTLIKGDFTGPNSFVAWLAALLGIGALGYIKPIKPVTDAFILLLIIVLFLSNGGFFAKINQQLGITK